MDADRPGAATLARVSAPRLRRSVRVLLLDAGQRVLLLRLSVQVAGCSLWIAPGGGLNAGESVIDGACRELSEELGWKLRPDLVIGPVWRQTLVEVGFFPGYDGVTNDYLVARVPGRDGGPRRDGS
jgi:8-oxo-dGTP diphosphatase